MSEHQQQQPAEARRRASASRARRSDTAASSGNVAPSDPQKSRKRGYMMTAGAITLCAMLGMAATSLVSGGGDPAPSQAELTQMEENLAILQSEGLATEPVAAVERDAAIAGMGLNDEQSAEVQQSVEAGATDLVWVTVWDNRDEDGDVVTVESDWFKVEVPITNAGATVAVPKPSSGVVNIRGSFDGGGGVTMGFVVDGQSLPIPPMNVGQAVGVKVR